VAEKASDQIARSEKGNSRHASCAGRTPLRHPLGCYINRVASLREDTAVDKWNNTNKTVFVKVNLTKSGARLP